MDSLVIIIGDNFIGGIDYYKTAIRTMKIRKIPVSPIQIISNKKILGLDDEVIVSPNLTKMLKSEDWIFVVPGQPGLYGIVPSAYNGIGIMTIPARGDATADFIKKVHDAYPELRIIPVILTPGSLNGSLGRLTSTYNLTDEIASKIYNDYKEHTDWREGLVPADLEGSVITVEYPTISSSSLVMYVGKLIDKLTKKED